MCLRFIVKYLLFVFNLLFFILGAAIIALGVIVHLKLDEIKETISVYFDVNNITILPIVLIVIGSVIFLIAFSGCCGAICESKCLIIAYACAMLILAAVKIYIAVTLFKNMSVYRDRVEAFVDEVFVDPSHNTTIHAVEHTFKCCGTNGADSYDDILDYLPPTCCEGVLEACLSEGDSDIMSCLCEKDDAYEDGCRTVLGDYFVMIAKYTGYGFIVLIVVEILSMGSAVYLANTINIKHQTKRI